MKPFKMAGLAVAALMVAQSLGGLALGGPAFAQDGLAQNGLSPNELAQNELAQDEPQDSELNDFLDMTIGCIAAYDSALSGSPASNVAQMRVSRDIAIDTYVDMSGETPEEVATDRAAAAVVVDQMRQQDPALVPAFIAQCDAVFTETPTDIHI